MSLQKSSITTTDHEWLPMPSGISITSHNSFTTDLLYQFDKRRSHLLYNQEHVSSSSIENSIHQQVRYYLRCFDLFANKFNIDP